MSPDILNETDRLAALGEYGIKPAFSDQALDRLVQVTANVFDVPIVLVSLVEAERQLFAARVGINVCETSRDVSFCSHAIRGDDVMVVPDALEDPRFQHNALVTGEPYIRFYAGVPLRAPSGHAIGTLCLIDRRPRHSFDEQDRQNLKLLGSWVVKTLELCRLEQGRRASQFQFENIAITSPDAIICTDHNSIVTFFNQAAEKLLGFSAGEIVGRNADIMAPPAMLEKLQSLATAGESLLATRTVEIDIQRKDGSTVPVELSVSAWYESGQASFGAILRDINDRRANEARLFRLAHIDPLTALPNRAFLRNRIEESLEVEDSACILLVDLDGFKDVNDSMGHSAGDAALVEVADRLRFCVRDGDTVARMGGDEFAILIPGVADPTRASQAADAMIETIAEIRSVDGQPVNIGASVGIAIFPAHGAHAEELLSSADLALYQAKAEGRHCRRFFTPNLREVAILKRAYQGELRRAYDQGEFELYYQPQVQLSDGMLVGAEALLRWKHPEKGVMGPAAFLSALETSPIAAQVGEWAIRTATLQSAEWRHQSGRRIRMGVNLFGAQFRTGDLAQKVTQALQDAALPPSALELEITENIILRHDEEMIGPLRDLHKQGVGIAFDDYGTGYASLSMLKRYPLTRLKVDQSFVRAMCQSPADAAIVRAILYLGHSFGLNVVAEGIETEQQAERLRKKGCEEGQGFLYGRPMPAAEFTARFGLSSLGGGLRCAG